MKELTDTEIPWIEAFAKHHEFFASFLLHYNLKNHLANNQYYWLWLYINQAEENSDTLVIDEEITFLEENSENKEELREMLEKFIKIMITFLFVNREIFQNMRVL